jgi:biotin synthase
MVGIGPFILQKDTPFASQPPGNLNLCLKMITISRLILPKALIPATTAMGTIAPNGRELALEAGANVFMPNLTPTAFRKLYTLYDDKICTGDDAVMCMSCMKNRIVCAGFEAEMVRGDAKG